MTGGRVPVHSTQNAAPTKNTLSTVGQVLASLQKLLWRLILGRPPSEPLSFSRGDESNSHLTPVLSFPGWGIYFFWQLGVLEYLMKHFDLTHVDMIGSSGGSFIGPFAKCGVDPRYAAKLTHDLTLKHNIWSRPWGLVGVWGGLVRDWLQQLLPDDAAARCSNTVGVVVCSVPTFRSCTIHDYVSKADLVQVLLASAHVPFVLDLRPAARCRDGWAVDGSFTFVVSGKCAHLVPVSKLGERAVCERAQQDSIGEPVVKAACTIARGEAVSVGGAAVLHDAAQQPQGSHKGDVITTAASPDEGSGVAQLPAHVGEAALKGQLRQRRHVPPNAHDGCVDTRIIDERSCSAAGIQQDKQHQENLEAAEACISHQQPAAARILAVVPTPVADMMAPPVLVFDPRMDVKLRDSFTISRCLNLLTLEGAYALMDAGALYAEALHKQGAFNAIPQLRGLAPPAHDMPSGSV